MDAWIAGAIFLGTYALIATELVHKTVAALAGGVLMVAVHILSQEEAFHAIDFNVIFLLLGMMVIANVMRTTGVFQWLAIRSIRIAGADPWRIMVALCLITAVASAFLDNVTTVVLVGPVTLYLAAALGVSPVPYLIAEILASNVGGMATLIGDPPNILIGSAAGIDFSTFAWNMAPISVIILAVFFVFARVAFARELAEQRHRIADVDLDESGVITEPRLMRISVAVLLLTIGGFVMAAPLGYEPATVALLGATALFIVGRVDPAEVLERVEWTTLLFFVGLFMLVEGVIHVGIISGIAALLFDVTGGEPVSTSISLLWISGVASGIIDNIPYTVTVIPIIQDLQGRGVDVEPLWWSLAMGADLGGNATIIGASANVVIASLAARAGHRLTFIGFMRYGVPMVALSLAVATIYLVVRYLL
jgi:Na+/H+ antiporter NhaD/arsenite permease-like protein